MMLIYNEPILQNNLEEVIMSIQGYLLDANLPPIRQFQYVSLSVSISLYVNASIGSIPHNMNQLVDIKQSVTLTGLGASQFQAAVRGVICIYQWFKTHLEKRGCQLRPWAPGSDGSDGITLTFNNRLLTNTKDCEPRETLFDLADTVDPFNILRPLLRTEVHTIENQVQY